MKADQEATEGYPEKMEANPEEMKSLTVHEEVPKEEAAVETFGALKEWYGDWHPAVGCWAQDPGQWWVFEEVDHCLQRDDPPFHSCMS
jgi:hypothetical protein